MVKNRRKPLNEYTFNTEIEAIAFAEGVELAAAFYNACETKIRPPPKRGDSRDWTVIVDLFDLEEEG